MAYGRTYDLTDNPMNDLAIARTMGGGVGSYFANKQARADEQKKEYDKLYLEMANERLVNVLSTASTQNWDKERTHAEILKIPKWGQLESGRRYAERLHNEYLRENRKGAAGESEPLTRMKSLIDMRHSYTTNKLGTVGWDEANDKTLKWIDLEISKIRNAGEDVSGGVPTPTQAPSVGSDALASKMQAGANKIFGTVGEVAVNTIKDSEIAEAVKPEDKDIYKIIDTELLKYNLNEQERKEAYMWLKSGKPLDGIIELLKSN